jgi:hypothetical protein
MPSLKALFDTTMVRRLANQIKRGEQTHDEMVYLSLN